MRIKDFIWFAKRWKPIVIRWNSSKRLWGMARKRQRLEQFMGERVKFLGGCSDENYG